MTQTEHEPDWIEPYGPRLERRISVAGLLAMMGGMSLVVAYASSQILVRAWRGISGAVFVALAAILILWGIRAIILGLYPALARTRHKHRRGQRVVISRQGVGYMAIMIALFVGSLMGQSNMLMLVFALMTGPFVLNGWLTYSILKRANVERRVPDRVMAGESFTVDVVLSNQRRWGLSAWLVTARDQLQSAREQLDVSVLFSRVAPGKSGTARYRVKLSQRGRYILPALTLSSRFPLGLIARMRTFEVKDELLVYPRVGKLTSNWRKEFSKAQELVQPRSLRRGAMQDEFHRLREFRWGDNPRAIHWRTSARRSEVMVCEYRQSRDRHLMLLLDLWLPKRPSRDDVQRVEAAIRFAATICVEHLRHSHDAELALLGIGNTMFRWRGRAGSASVEAVLDLLAEVEGGRTFELAHLLEDSYLQHSTSMQQLLVSSRSQDSLKTLHLNDTFTSRLAGEAAASMQVVEADPAQLANLFSMD